MARSEAPESAKAAGNSYPLCLPPPRQSSTLPPPTGLDPLSRNSALPTTRRVQLQLFRVRYWKSLNTRAGFPVALNSASAGVTLGRHSVRVRRRILTSTVAPRAVA